MRPLTYTTAKSLLPVLGKPILTHILELLPPEVTDVIIVVGYLKEQIMAFYGERFGRVNVRYIEQDMREGNSRVYGTYSALALCRPYLVEGERYMFLYGDELHTKESAAACIRANALCLVTMEVPDPRRFGVVEVDERDMIVGFEEKPDHPKSNLVSAGLMVLDTDVFKYPAVRHSNGEYYLVDSIAQMIRAGYEFRVVRTNLWIPLATPEDLKKAEGILSKRTD